MPRLARLLRIGFYGSTGAVALGLAALVAMVQPRRSDDPAVADPEVIRRLKMHVEVLAGEAHNDEHPVPYAAAKAYIYQSLASVGYAVNLDDAGNVIARRQGVAPGGEARPVLLGAHYDSANYSPGADDNASGVAVMLEVAAALAGTAEPVEFHAYANEEPPCFKTACMGSLAAAAAAGAAGTRFSAIVVLDAVGFYSSEPGSQRWPLALPGLPRRGDFLAVVGDFAAAREVFRVSDLLASTSPVPISRGVVPHWISGSDWSDHWSWRHHGYVAVMITDTATFRNENYHEVTDTPGSLDYERLAGFTASLVHTIASLASS
ncbi:hypothetical protein LBMAG42_35660 [Deltaproteobacteria bacterium]|nr:hypothetical protein LBMAG42_35660 [Deltaproteobacteria bacterium]